MILIASELCKKGFAYRIHSRNLDVGVYDGQGGFVGLREKFNTEFLFTEVHRDRGGTVSPKEELGFCPIEDLAESHSKDGYAVTNKPLFDWLKALEATLPVT